MLGSQRPHRAHKMDKLAYYFFMFLKKKFNSHSKKCVFLSLLAEEMKEKNKKKSFQFFCLCERDKIKHWRPTRLKRKISNSADYFFTSLKKRKNQKPPKYCVFFSLLPEEMKSKKYEKIHFNLERRGFRETNRLTNRIKWNSYSLYIISCFLRICCKPSMPSARKLEA